MDNYTAQRKDNSKQFIMTVIELEDLMQSEVNKKGINTQSINKSLLYRT